ncbi:hypothetical protein Scep_015150 [Stephania cephalantha]|uniref:Uncharacterized protein n=1 Tax=Stephania cephalantha TaxID=152367 RepID=A0AAP0J2N2_9MAGN
MLGEAKCAERSWGCADRPAGVRGPTRRGARSCGRGARSGGAEAQDRTAGGEDRSAESYQQRSASRRFAPPWEETTNAASERSSSSAGRTRFTAARRASKCAMRESGAAAATLHSTTMERRPRVNVPTTGGIRSTKGDGRPILLAPDGEMDAEAVAGEKKMKGEVKEDGRGFKGLGISVDPAKFPSPSSRLLPRVSPPHSSSSSRLSLSPARALSLSLPRRSRSLPVARSCRSSQPAIRSSVQRELASVIQPILEKGIVDHSIIHRALLEYLSIADKSSATDVIEQLSGPLLVRMIGTRDGAKLGMLCIKHGGAKGRKKIIKGMKGHVGKIAHDQYGCMVLVSILSMVDDTKLLSKVAIRELQPILKELVFDKGESASGDGATGREREPLARKRARAARQGESASGDGATERERERATGRDARKKTTGGLGKGREIKTLSV